MKALLMLTVVLCFSNVSKAADQTAQTIDPIAYAEKSSNAFAESMSDWTPDDGAAHCYSNGVDFTSIGCTGKYGALVHDGAEFEFDYTCTFEFKNIGEGAYEVTKEDCE